MEIILNNYIYLSLIAKNNCYSTTNKKFEESEFGIYTIESHPLLFNKLQMWMDLRKSLNYNSIFFVLFNSY